MNQCVVMTTSCGVLRIELFEDKAPISAQNFLAYAERGFYHNTLFHRVIKDVLIHGGGYELGLQRKRPRAPIRNESANGLLNRRGTLAYARTHNPDSATNQFFINLDENRMLDRDRCPDGIGYCVFGQVIDGLEVADRIASVPTVSFSGLKNVPSEEVFIHSVLSLRQIEREHAGDENVRGLIAALCQPDGDRHLWDILGDRLEDIGSRFAPQARPALFAELMNQGGCST